MKRIFLIYFFPFLNTYKFQYVGRLGGKTVLRCTYLFRRVHFQDSFLLRGSGVSLESGGKAPVIFCPKILFRSFPGVLATVSAHLFTPTAVQELKMLFPISSDEKGLLPVLRLQPIIWLLSSSCLFHRVMLLNDQHFLLRPPGYRVQVALSFSFWIGFVPLFNRLAARNWPSFISLF